MFTCISLGLHHEMAAQDSKLPSMQGRHAEEPWGHPLSCATLHGLSSGAFCSERESAIKRLIHCACNHFQAEKSLKRSCCLGLASNLVLVPKGPPDEQTCRKHRRLAFIRYRDGEARMAAA
mmetsp:Transcript_26015/g.79103  ORF Transcript_26015/g.79103 Transcript_26015/m.79103 type:complete len:121 (+) Transcript_26015:480-842(+)